MGVLRRIKNKVKRVVKQKLDVMTEPRWTQKTWLDSLDKGERDQMKKKKKASER